MRSINASVSDLVAYAQRRGNRLGALGYATFVWQERAPQAAGAPVRHTDDTHMPSLLGRCNQHDVARRQAHV